MGVCVRVKQCAKTIRPIIHNISPRDKQDIFCVTPNLPGCTCESVRRACERVRVTQCTVYVCVGGCSGYHTDAINQMCAFKLRCELQETEILSSVYMNISPLCRLCAYFKSSLLPRVFTCFSPALHVCLRRCQSLCGMYLQGASSSHQRQEQFTHNVGLSPINNIQVALLLSEKLTGV